MTYCRNFIMALSVQLFIVKPIAEYLFRVLFSIVNGNEEKELFEEGFAKNQIFCTGLCAIFWQK